MNLQQNQNSIASLLSRVWHTVAMQSLHKYKYSLHRFYYTSGYSTHRFVQAPSRQWSLPSSHSIILLQLLFWQMWSIQLWRVQGQCKQVCLPYY